MSWTAFIAPLQFLPIEVLEWAAGASSAIGDVDNIPNAQPLATLGQALDAIRLAGCHGDSWFRITDDASIERLPRCLPATDCAEQNGLDLGEISISVVGDDTHGGPITPDALVESMSFRKPHGLAILHAAIALAAVGGAQLVFDDSGDRIAVVRPTDQLDNLAKIWLW